MTIHKFSLGQNICPFLKPSFGSLQTHSNVAVATDYCCPGSNGLHAHFGILIEASFETTEFIFLIPVMYQLFAYNPSTAIVPGTSEVRTTW